MPNKLRLTHSLGLNATILVSIYKSYCWVKYNHGLFSCTKRGQNWQILNRQPTPSCPRGYWMPPFQLNADRTNIPWTCSNSDVEVKSTDIFILWNFFVILYLMLDLARDVENFSGLSQITYSLSVHCIVRGKKWKRFTLSYCISQLKSFTTYWMSWPKMIKSGRFLFLIQYLQSSFGLFNILRNILGSTHGLAHSCLGSKLGKDLTITTCFGNKLAPLRLHSRSTYLQGEFF